MAKENFDAVLDAVCPKNRNPLFYPLQMTLRGEARQEEAKGKSINTAYQVVGGVIPGDRVMVDMKNRKLKIVDRMSLPENAGKLEALRKLTYASEDHWQCKFSGVKADSEHTAGQAEWPGWLFHLRRMLDMGKLRLVSGSLPSCAECLRMGKVQVGSPYARPLDKDRPYYMLDERDIENFEPASA